jgi:hypothetical protein
VQVSLATNWRTVGIYRKFLFKGAEALYDLFKALRQPALGASNSNPYQCLNLTKFVFGYVDSTFFAYNPDRRKIPTTNFLEINGAFRGFSRRRYPGIFNCPFFGFRFSGTEGSAEARLGYDEGDPRYEGDP